MKNLKFLPVLIAILALVFSSCFHNPVTESQGNPEADSVAQAWFNGGDDFMIPTSYHPITRLRMDTNSSTRLMRLYDNNVLFSTIPYLEYYSGYRVPAVYGGVVYYNTFMLQVEKSRNSSGSQIQYDYYFFISSSPRITMRKTDTLSSKNMFESDGIMIQKLKFFGDYFIFFGSSDNGQIFAKFDDYTKEFKNYYRKKNSNGDWEWQ